MIGGSAGFASEWREIDETAGRNFMLITKNDEKEWTGSPGDP
jgi:hypothetical protein